MSTTHLLAFFFGAGPPSSPAHAPIARKLVIKPKRRKYTFPNGITVWATSEAMARLFAGVGEESPTDSDYNKIDIAPVADQPEAAAPSITAQTAPDEASDALRRAPAEIDYTAEIARHEAATLRHKLDAAIAATVREADAVREAVALGERMRAEAERKAQALRIRRMREDEEAIIVQLLMENA